MFKISSFGLELREKKHLA